MKVRVLLNLGTNDYGPDALEAGEHEVSDTLAATLIKNRHAVEIVAPPPVVTAIEAAGLAEVPPDKFAELRASEGIAVTNPEPVKVEPAVTTKKTK